MVISESAAVELGPIREMLRFYCHALTERSVDVHDLKQLVDQNIGWSNSGAPTSDGAAIFLPHVVERFGARAENFALLKVMLTQQAGHVEFGSFDFQFARPSTQFDDWRSKLEAPPAYHDHDHGHEGHDEDAGATELWRFFRLFPGKRLARDIFAIVEGGRVEAQVMREYRGIAKAYDAMRRQELRLRPEITLLPAREALLEFIVRLTLGGSRGLKIPGKLKTLAREIGAAVQRVLAPAATVEDAAEATLRIYARLAKTPNDYLEPGDFEKFTDRPEAIDRPRRGQRSNGRENRETAAALPALTGREREYLSPQAIDYRGDFRPELAQLLSRSQANSREQRKSLTAEELADLLRSQRTPKPRDSEEEGDEQDPQTSQMVQNLLRELDKRDPRMQSTARRPSGSNDDDDGALAATQPNTYVYDEWNVFDGRFRARWCKVHEKLMPAGDSAFYRETLLNRRPLLKQIRGEFEQVMPELYRKEKRLPDGVEHDLDAAVEALTDLRAGKTPSEKIFGRQHKIDRDVAVAFLLDMSGSTGEAIARPADGAGAADGPVQRRIIDVEREAIVLMSDALETIGDRYGIYGFSGHGRDNVEFYVIKDIGEDFTQEIARRFGGIAPLHATRMGPAIRHATMKLGQEQSRAKFLFLISDGRPQDRGYSQESSEKAYAVQDTRMALLEARGEGIHPFCLTVDKEGNDYLRAMMGDFSYEVLADVRLLPRRLPQLYRRLTM
jgi:nitric oxide reductase activation protein